MTNLFKALSDIEKICEEWRDIQDTQAGSGGWPFNYKLYNLAYNCEDPEEFQLIADNIFEEWKEATRIVAGYSKDKWRYYDYFTHDNHNGSYFTFRENYESSESLDFWANNIGLEWDSTEGDWWKFIPFEKAINACYGVTRFSTDRLVPDDYSKKELEEVTEELNRIIPKLRETLKDRANIIEIYENMKASQCEWLVHKEYF